MTKQHREERRLLENEIFKQADINAKLANEMFGLREENLILKEGIRKIKNDKARTHRDIQRGAKMDGKEEG